MPAKTPNPISVQRGELLLRETKSCSIRIYVGLESRDAFYGIERAISICDAYCQETGFCVTVEPVTYTYTGSEPEQGCAVGLINYPRFPSSESDLMEHAFVLAERLIKGLDQWGASIVTPNNTFLLSHEDGWRRNS